MSNNGNNDKPVFTGLSSDDLCTLEEMQVECFTENFCENMEFFGEHTASVEHYLNSCTARLYRTFA